LDGHLKLFSETTEAPIVSPRTGATIVTARPHLLTNPNYSNGGVYDPPVFPIKNQDPVYGGDFLDDSEED
jgi:hypothetical protein